jgi:AcrR family transcriptional regulator
MTKESLSQVGVTEEPGEQAAGAAPTPARAHADRGPLRADARRNVDRLIAVAREAFAERGAEASMDDIARRAGVGSGTLYRHFPTKAALIEAVYRDGVETLCARGDELLVTRPPTDALFEWLRALVDYVTQKRGLARSLLSSIDTSALFAETHARIAATGGAQLARAKAIGAVRPDVELMDVIRLASAIAAAGEQSPEGAALSDRLLRLAFDGLRATPGLPE